MSPFQYYTWGMSFFPPPLQKYDLMTVQSSGNMSIGILLYPSRRENTRTISNKVWVRLSYLYSRDISYVYSIMERTRRFTFRWLLTSYSYPWCTINNDRRRKQYLRQIERKFTYYKECIVEIKVSNQYVKDHKVSLRATSLVL